MQNYFFLNDFPINFSFYWSSGSSEKKFIGFDRKQSEAAENSWKLIENQSALIVWFESIMSYIINLIIQLDKRES